MNQILKGIIPPLVTPLQEDGSLDEKGLKRLVDHCIRGGVDGIFILGSCGEGSVFPIGFRKEFTQKTLEFAAGRVPVLVGVLDNSTPKVIEGIKALAETGAEYFVVTAPYYLAVTGQEAIYRHYQTVAASTEKKIVIYNIPSFTHTNIAPETAARLLRDIDNIAGEKDSTDDWAQFEKELFLKTEETGSLLSGCEETCALSMLLGADGCVPCLANAYPAFFAELYAAAREGNVEKVFSMQKEITELRAIMGCGYWVSIVKYLCARKDLIQDYPAAPEVPLTAEQKQAVEGILATMERFR